MTATPPRPIRQARAPQSIAHRARARARLVTLVILLLVPVATAGAPPAYQLTPLAPLENPAGTVFAGVSDLNNHGTIIGNSRRDGVALPVAWNILRPNEPILLPATPAANSRDGFALEGRR
jgi:hypothetical protein